MDVLKVVKVNKEAFSLQVRSHAADTGESLLDSIMHITEKNKLEIEVIPRLLTKELKELLEIEAAKLKLVIREEREELQIE